MKRKVLAIRKVAAVVAMAMCTPALSLCQASVGPPAAANWEHASPESQGYSTPRLEAVKAWLKTEPTTAMMVIVNGKVIFEYGDVARVSKIASVRKSVLSMLMGNYVTAGKIDTGKTVEELGLQDKEPFLPLEKRATLEQLMTARSAIYMDERTDELTRRQPERGVEYPGTTFFYNNWEFDAAGTAFEKLTGKNIYDALETDLARPLGMQDFQRDLQVKVPSPGSVHPEYAMYLSTRDMARLGLMMLQSGSWHGKQVVPGDWVRYSTAVITPWDEMNPAMLRLRGMPERWGFGAGWWVWDAAPFPGGIWASPYQGAYEARGTGGQYITVLWARDMVIVHKVDLAIHPSEPEWVSQQEWDAITNMVIGAACHGKCM